ncbi:MAG TPA: methionine--tRNA ligase, partial [Polyangiaceae bacterium]|nr:methionine--tRNA ligase [Polyangiaceae bacterium]
MNDRTKPLFVSTAIPYVNAAPHVGHAFELVLGDALSRHHRQRGRAVFLSGGTDDHSLKNARAAAERGVSTAALVAEHAAIYRRLHRALDIELDGWLRTSNDPRHLPAVTELWNRCAAAGDLYQDEYSGLYCTGCEAFVSEAELVQGGCATHRDPLERVQEKNWFFRLSRYESALLAALESRTLRVEPRERHNEVLSFVRSGLRDFSVSRSHSRARGWGLPVPGDPSQVIYVWFDALTNYLSVLGHPESTQDFERFWRGPCDREHLIGKDVLR